MNVEQLRECCLFFNGVEECFPFDDTTLVFKVGGKIFALISLDGPLSINLKCKPDLAIELREQFNAVLPGYHMNKKHWNTISIDGTIPAKIINDWILHSYELVVDSLPKKTKAELFNK